MGVMCTRMSGKLLSVLEEEIVDSKPLVSDPWGSWSVCSVLK